MSTETEPAVCEVCQRLKEPHPDYKGMMICKCNGLQTYSMSTYPGEHCLTPIHPENTGEGEQHWYKREDVDARLKELNDRIAKLERMKKYDLRESR